MSFLSCPWGRSGILGGGQFGSCSNLNECDLKRKTKQWRWVGSPGNNDRTCKCFLAFGALTKREWNSARSMLTLLVTWLSCEKQHTSPVTVCLLTRIHTVMLFPAEMLGWVCVILFMRVYEWTLWSCLLARAGILLLQIHTALYKHPDLSHSTTEINDDSRYCG